MALVLYNTLSREKQIFTPLDEENVRFFVCGPTVYGPMHVGHAKTYTQFDFIARVLKQLYPSLRYVMNTTDVDDKIIALANASNRDPIEVAREWEQKFWASMHGLSNDRVTEVYRAHDHIDEVVSQVQRLVALGKAYVIEGSGVYFDLSTFPSHGRLARRSENGEELTRLEGQVEKRNAGDFVLWKFTKHRNEPSWPSALGSGRPGWHIEDTAITEKYLGSSYDIHGGATDLIFPHHEAEIAQMEAISGEPLVNYWLHTGLLNTGGKKMGKSLNNFITVDELLARWDSRTLRYSLLNAHYRSTLDFTEANIEASEQARARVETYYSEQAPKTGLATYEKFWAALLDDFNTPKALAFMFQDLKTGEASQESLGAINTLMGNVFNFEVSEIPANVIALAQAREVYRKNKAWAQADEARNAINALGYSVKDGKDNYVLARMS